MRVRCTQILTNRPVRTDQGDQTEDLTIGKEYVVLCIYFRNSGILLYQIESDAGELIIFEADQFEILSSHIPSNWDIHIEIDSNEVGDSSYYMKLAPTNWREALFDFYEEIIESSTPLEEWRADPHMTKVMQLYFQEKDIIYQEEMDIKRKIKKKNLETK